VRPLARVLVAGFAAGCASAGARPAPLAPETRALAAELDSVFGHPEFARAMWGVHVQSLETGEILYSRNAARWFKPASNLKILTGAAALVTLGADWRYHTPVLARGARTGDTLRGDLVVLGRGDPSLSQPVAGGDDILAALRPWADSVAVRGIRVITGRVVGDASWFPDPFLGEGWMWDDLPYYYDAPVGALMFNESVAEVRLTAGPATGDSVRVAVAPSDAPLRVFAMLTTASADSSVRIDWTRAPFSDSVPVTGRIPAGRAPLTLTVSVPDPTRYFEAALTQVLRERGITVLGAAGAAGDTASDTLFTWQSITLAELLPHFEKPSQNQIGEALLRTIGGVRRGVASRDSGRAVLGDVLRSFGVPDDAWRIADGSGASHYNYVAPEVLARTLVAVSRRPDADVFINALPIMGVDGTLRSRMRDTPAQGNVHAKTGTISGARSLSGYLTTDSGERLVFVLLANHFPVPLRTVDRAAEHVVERLIHLPRRRR